MDQLERYRAIVRRLIEEYASYKPAYGDIRTEAVVDRERDHYEVIQVGWNGDRRVHGSIIHIDIRDGKAILDERHRQKQPDWSYNKLDSGTVPVEKYQAVPPPWNAEQVAHLTTTPAPWRLSGPVAHRHR